MISDSKKEKIALAVIKTLLSRFESFPEDSAGNRNAPFHEAFLNAFTDKLQGRVEDIPFLISLSSWLHGLNTTMGQSFFENVAHTLSDGTKRDFTKTRDTLLTIKPSQKTAIGEIITDLKNGDEEPDLGRENELIFLLSDEQAVEANSFTADVYLESEEEIFAVELKSVKPNAGEMRGEKQKILEAKSALFTRSPEKMIRFFIGFPFDPTSETEVGYDKSRFLSSIVDGGKYFSQDEILLSEELWDTLSGDTDTMQQILDIINHIATPAFMEKLAYLNNVENRVNPLYRIYLGEWFLYSELSLLNKQTAVTAGLAGNATARKRYNQDIIFGNGEYNWDRFEILDSF